ncbi:hypothetical protein OIU77_025717 [Salix suchowensis]|uniref:Uncharacterized protein n=1 Tax=Salix suchowensis TaxID=1278906 RepID=A0ABQ9BY08_9ROSI|nr:hypothetical protein OIU77_025717 [Salix suchowensis]
MKKKIREQVEDSCQFAPRHWWNSSPFGDFSPSRVAAEAETPAPPSSIEALKVERRKGGFVGLIESEGLKMKWCLEEKEGGRRVGGGGNKDIDMEIVELELVLASVHGY